MIIGLSGYAGSGKSTVGERLVLEHGFTRLGFADALRELALEANPVVGERYLRDHITEVGWEHWKMWGDGRRFLQNLGVGARKVVGDDVWILALEKKYAALDGDDPDVVITDVRFTNEAKWVHYTGGFVVRINRAGVGPANHHASEIGLDQWPFDYVISNEEGIPQLHQKVDRSLEHLCKSYRSGPTSSTPGQPKSPTSGSTPRSGSASRKPSTPSPARTRS